MGGGGGVAGSQPMSTAVHLEPKINFGNLTSYLTYDSKVSSARSADLAYADRSGSADLAETVA